MADTIQLVSGLTGSQTGATVALPTNRDRLGTVTWVNNGTVNTGTNVTLEGRMKLSDGTYSLWTKIPIAGTSSTTGIAIPLSGGITMVYPLCDEMRVVIAGALTALSGPVDAFLRFGGA